ncbi:sensor histidine kinase [Amycolatopsis australiensis]|uniref:Histidine kinase-, DNA gyrase B-, and HSP90-like ATPase n=1 Tax=Amycolatopsis australiensis TaxID=546364 RepID=A0A1K1SQB9_9PSEU|nr:ATP-binding protein [Amycolatopsis australiensis]SFW86513.1 Histidine kinase-, DNA gyrase B-, and HSP90-like ATPase [Amycolatopsis australiensis]
MTSEAGPVERQFRASVAHFAGPSRAVATAVVGVFGVVATPGRALPLAFGLLVLTLVAGAVDVAGAPRTSFALSVLRVGAVGAAQPWLTSVPGEASLWAVNVLTLTAITWQWEHPPRLTVPALVLVLAVAVGADAGVWLPVVPRVVVESVLARLAFVVLLRSTARTDSARAGRAAAEQAAALDRDRRRREREYLALLHDTASATFLAVASGAVTDPAAVAGYAAHDLAVLTGGHDPGAEDTPLDLEAGLRMVVAGRALPVDAGWVPVPLVPASAALAVLRAADEALRNAERHSGAGSVTVRLAPAPAPGGVTVTIADDGVGFDPAQVPAARRGVRGSVVERMRAAGGTAEITSRPGAGTTVTLRWSRA